MPKNELANLQAVNRFLKLEITKDAELQQIAQQASMICDAPIAMITIMDDQKQYIKFRVGTDLTEVDYNNTFCQYTIIQDELIMVSDTTADPRFQSNPFVTGDAHIRFYAGTPLVDGDGNNVGTVCVYDTEKKTLSGIQQRLLQCLSKQVIHLLEFDASLQLMKQQFISSRETAIKLRSFFESSSSCHVLLDPQMHVLAFNRAMADFVSKSSGKSLQQGEPATSYLHPEFSGKYINCFNEAFSGKTVTLERQLEYPHGRICWYMTFAPAFDQDERISGVSFNAVDITAKVEQEEKLNEKNIALSKIRKIQLNDLEQPVTEIVRLMAKLNATGYANEREEKSLLNYAVIELEEKLNIS